MSQSCFAKTESRRVLGCLNDFMFHLKDGCARDTGLSLEERALQLANMPCASIEFAYPSEYSVSLFRTLQALTPHSKRNGIPLLPAAGQPVTLELVKRLGDDLL